MRDSQVFLVLTSHQRRVLDAFMRDGADNDTVARRVGLSVDTTKCHMRAVFAQAGVPNRAALALELVRGRAVVRGRLPRRPLACPVAWQPSDRS